MNMLKHGGAVIDPRTVSVQQEIKQIAIEYVVGKRGLGKRGRF